MKDLELGETRAESVTHLELGEEDQLEPVEVVDQDPTNRET